MDSTKITENSVKSNGGPSSYYDIPIGTRTLNDLIEIKSELQWLGHSPHLKDIIKSVWRWGAKEGTSKEYDSRKIIYYGCRLLRMISGNDAVRKELQRLLDDPQFKDSK